MKSAFPGVHWNVPHGGPVEEPLMGRFRGLKSNVIKCMVIRHQNHTLCFGMSCNQHIHGA